MWGKTAQVRMSRIGLLALAVQALNWLAAATALLSGSAFEHYSRVFDGSSWLVGFETLLVFAPGAALLVADYRSMPGKKWQWKWQMWANRILILASLGYVVLYVIVLRIPWLLGQAGASDRITVWAARLSSTNAGIPLTAFMLALGMGVHIWCVSMACLRALRTAKVLDDPEVERRAEVLVWSLCAFVILVGLATIVTFATGGTV